jgi:hypothetical protein
MRVPCSTSGTFTNSSMSGQPVIAVNATARLHSPGHEQPTPNSGQGCASVGGPAACPSCKQLGLIQCAWGTRTRAMSQPRSKPRRHGCGSLPGPVGSTIWQQLRLTCQTMHTTWGRICIPPPGGCGSLESYRVVPAISSRGLLVRQCTWLTCTRSPKRAQLTPYPSQAGAAASAPRGQQASPAQVRTLPSPKCEASGSGTSISLA